MMAAEHGHLAVVKELLQHDAQVDLWSEVSRFKAYDCWNSSVP